MASFGCNHNTATTFKKRNIFCLWIFLYLSLTTTTTLALNFTFGFTSDTIGARYEYFEIGTTVGITSELKCVDEGARCVFDFNHFETTSFGDGQQTFNLEGAVWASLNITRDVLTLSECKSTDDPLQCMVVCNANCTCQTTTAGGNEDSPRNNCTQLESLPCNDGSALACPSSVQGNTGADPTPSDAAAQCPKRINTEFCPELMQTAAPLGSEGNYDCLNFCGGVFLSACNLQTGSCGPTECDNATASGTLTGQVQGCTDEDRTKERFTGSVGGQSANGTSDATNFSSSRIGYWVVSVLAFFLTWSL